MARVFVPALAIVAIAALEAWAIYNGINGKVLTLTCALIAGIGGYKLKDIKEAIFGQTMRG